jgi:GMP synthase-like glutamine amidotransferase
MAQQQWTMLGEYMESCNCDYLCPCVYTNPQGPVHHDHCTAALVLRTDADSYGDIKLHGCGWIPRREDYDMRWVIGGPMDGWDVAQYPWLSEEKRAIWRFVRELERPYLGICLGHQLLASALGGTCEPQRPPEIGVLPVTLSAAGRMDPLFDGMAGAHTALQWHGVRVAEPPTGAVVLASSPACACQAMRVGRWAYSLQYHIEIEAEVVGSWAAIPGYAQSLEQLLGPDAAPRLEADAEGAMGEFASSAARLYRNFMGIARQHPRFSGSPARSRAE